jgi:hypothetical protein
LQHTQNVKSATLAMHSLTLAIGAVAIGCSLIGLAFGFPPAFVFLFWGFIVVAGTIFERGRYRPAERTTPGANWTRTNERFFDENGKAVTVWLDQSSGERRYIAE